MTVFGGVKKHHKNQFNNSYDPLGGFQFQFLGVDSKQQNNQKLYNLSIVAVDGKKKCLLMPIVQCGLGCQNKLYTFHG